MTAAIALLSGGLDSCVALAEALRQSCGGEVAVMHAGYGQRTEDRERRAYLEIADHYGLETRREVDLRYLRDLGGSSLTDPSLPIPGDDPESEVPGTYVPFRNASLLSAAVAWAEVLGASEVFCGAQAPGSPYPDTRPVFFRAFGRLVEAATPASVEIAVRTPLIHLDKAAIVRRGVELGAPLHLTWSCYLETERPCGACRSCRHRSRGFDAAGLSDPLASRC